MSVVCWFLHAEVEGCGITEEEAARASPFRGLEHELVSNLMHREMTGRRWVPQNEEFY
jgi:hypothetical protein